MRYDEIKMKPFLKWVGGKTQILEEVLASFPVELNNYHEPFLGGGSVLLGLLSSPERFRVSGTVYASDINSNLIGLYQNIQSRPEEVIAEVRRLVDEFSRCTEGGKVNRKAKSLQEALTSPESYYFWVRAQFNVLSADERTTVHGSAMLLFMNKTCFRGVYREGPHGFNVPFGNYKNPGIVDDDHLRTVSTLIQNVVFTTCSFTNSLTRVVEGDFVYLDPPYAPETETSFVSYTAAGFHREEHRKLFDRCHEMHQSGVRFMMSNADVPLVKEAFRSPVYQTRTLSCRRAIHSKKPEAKTNEVLITNY